MKILLLIPPTNLTKSYGKLKEFSNPQPSLGIAYIAAVLRDRGYDTKVVDAYVNGHNLKEISDIILSYSPQYIGISVLTSSAEVVYEIAEKIREIAPDTKIIMGNIHASLFADEVLSMNYADFVVHREGEMTMVELLKSLENGSSLDDVKGISFRKNGAIVNTPLRNHITELDDLPFPAWDLFPMGKYTTDPRTEVKKNVVETQLLATRGCPNQCTFCSSRMERSLGMKYRMRSPESVVDEMFYMNRTFGSEVFSFMDLAFPLVRKHALALCNEIIKRGLNRNIRWMTECRVKPLDYELLKVMKEAGCARVCFGIESGNDATLKMLKKNFTTDDVRRAVDIAHKADIEVDGMFMIGLPEETEETIKNTINFAIDINVRYAIFNLFVPYPGCELYDTLNTNNEIHYKSWSEFTSYPTYSGGKPVYVPKGLSPEKLMELQSWAMKKFYLRPRFVLHELRHFKMDKVIHYFQGLKGLFFKN